MEISDELLEPLPAGCGVARFLVLLDGPWATLIVRELLGGPRRFSELREVLAGISANTLTRRLRRFEAYGVIVRTIYAEVPPRVEYELTPLGRALTPVLAAMARWALSVPDPVSQQSDEASPLEQGAEHVVPWPYGQLKRSSSAISQG